MTWAMVKINFRLVNGHDITNLAVLKNLEAHTTFIAYQASTAFLFNLSMCARWFL